MVARILSLLALSFSAVSSKPNETPHSQKIIGHHDEPSNFIQSSIFGCRDFDLQSLPDPVILAPTYDRREFDDDNPFQGLDTFAHLDFTDCTKPENDKTFDIGIVGHPFDLGVSYRPGARFGPNGARQGARRISPSVGWE
jgi:agmatinase